MATNPVKRGFFRSALDAMMASRERQAAAYVSGALLMLDDDTLKSHGYDRETLKRRATIGYMF